jgi:predicted GIY-YIG superfamily endonuclease
MPYAYVIDCLTPNHVYIGQTDNLHLRLLEHAGKCLRPRFNRSPFLVKHGFEGLRWFTECTSRKKAIRLEQVLTKAFMKDGFVVRSDWTETLKDGSTRMRPALNDEIDPRVKAIFARQTENGGWKYSDLIEMGVEVPPKKGWLRQLIKEVTALPPVAP